MRKYARVCRSPRGWNHSRELIVPGSLLVFAFLMLTPAPAKCGDQSQRVEAEQYSEQARRAIAAKNWEEAAKALNRLLQLAPDVPEVQGNLGLVYYSQGRILEASKAFESALKLNPRMAYARLMLGLCWAELGRYAEAIGILEPAFRYPPENETARLVGLALARAYAGLGQDANAAGTWRKLLERYPNNAEILFQASRFHAGRSYDLMSRLFQSSPNSPWAHYATAEVHESLGRFDLAVAEYRKVLELEPRLPGVRFRIGRALLAGSSDASNVDQALKEFLTELMVAPQNADAEYEIGEIERHRGNLEAALTHFSKAVTYHRDFAEAHIGLARTLLSLGRASEAVPHLEEAVRLGPENDVPHFLLANAARLLGNRERAEKEVVVYQKLHASGVGAKSRPPGTGAEEVTRQTIEDRTEP